MLFFEVGDLLLDILEDMRGHFLHPEVFAFLSLRDWLDIVLVKLARRGRNHRMSLISPFFLLTWSSLVNPGPENDALAHKLDDGHQLEEDLHDAHPKLRYLHKLARIFDLFITKGVPMRSISYELSKVLTLLNM